MKTFVIYDITEDRIRNKIFQTCKNYGLAHIQYSAFFGELNHNRREELHKRLKRVIGQGEGRHPACSQGKIIIQPVCDKDFQLLREICVPEEADSLKEYKGAGRYLIK
jgi:CRISPR-associated protein Cas2